MARRLLQLGGDQGTEREHLLQELQFRMTSLEGQVQTSRDNLAGLEQEIQALRLELQRL